MPLLGIVRPRDRSDVELDAFLASLLPLVAALTASSLVSQVAQKATRSDALHKIAGCLVSLVALLSLMQATELLLTVAQTSFLFLLAHLLPFQVAVWTVACGFCYYNSNR